MDLGVVDEIYSRCYALTAVWKWVSVLSWDSLDFGGANGAWDGSVVTWVGKHIGVAVFYGRCYWGLL